MHNQYLHCPWKDIAQIINPASCQSNKHYKTCLGDIHRKRQISLACMHRKSSNFKSCMHEQGEISLTDTRSLILVKNSNYLQKIVSFRSCCTSRSCLPQRTWQEWAHMDLILPILPITGLKKTALTNLLTSWLTEPSSIARVALTKIGFLQPDTRQATLVQNWRRWTGWLGKQVQGYQL